MHSRLPHLLLSDILGQALRVPAAADRHAGAVPAACVAPCTLVRAAAARSLPIRREPAAAARLPPRLGWGRAAQPLGGWTGRGLTAALRRGRGVGV